MATIMRSQAGVQQNLSEYRVVLLGHRGSGKTSVINSILDTDDGSGVSSTAAAGWGVLQSIRRQGRAAGRSVTLVEAPGWWKNYPVRDTPEVTRREIAVTSVGLCPPGPHAFLLVVRLSSPFTEKHLRAVEEHVELLLGERAWRHAIVLFTYNDRLEFDVMESHMGSGREARHHWLVQRCQGRCHVFNVDKKGGGGGGGGDGSGNGGTTQVAELHKKIDEVVAGNGGGHYTERERIPPFWKPSDEGETIAAPVRGRRSSHLSKLRMVLLGYRRSRKSSAGNIILGQRCFEAGRHTAQSVCRQGQVGPAQQQRQQLTVVDTPGWWRGVSVSDTPELTKQEILLSASRCSPGPHALLLTHRVDFSFGEAELRALEEHLEPLGEDAWAHAMVLFTFGDLLRGASCCSIEQYIRAEGKALQRLLEKCGQRYHLLSNNKSDESSTQVSDLLEKIEAMAREEGGHFELNRKKVKSVKKRKVAIKKRAARRAKQQRQRESVKVFTANSYLMATLRIVLLGYSQSGKTSVGNAMLGPEVFDQKPTAFCEWHHRSIAGQRLSVVDTAGWQKSTPAVGTPSRTIEEMALSVPLCHPGPHAVLLVIRADASFGADEGRAACQHLELVLGKQVWRHTLVLFTCGDGLGGAGAGDAVTVEQYIESEGDALKEIVEKCGNRYHMLDNKTSRTSGANAQVLQLLEKLKGMVALNSGGHLETAGLWTDGARDGRGVVKDNTGREGRKTASLWTDGREDGRGETGALWTDGRGVVKDNTGRERRKTTSLWTDGREETGGLWTDGSRDGRRVNKQMMRSGEVRYGRGLEDNTGRDGRKETLDGNWMRLDVSEEGRRSRCLAEGRLHRFSKSSRCRYGPVHTEDTIWPDGFRKVSEEDQLDDVFLESSPGRRDAAFFSRHVHGPLTPIPSAEQSLASSSTSISKLV